MPLHACPHCGCELEDRRSTRANRYYHGVILKAFQERWSRGRVEAGLPPYTLQQTHYVLVTVIEGEEDGPLGKPIPKPTHNMTTSEFYRLSERARALAWDDYQMRIPEPNEAPDEAMV